MTNYFVRKSRRYKQNLVAFAALIETPFTGSASLPANAHLAVKATAPAAINTLAATITGATTRLIKTYEMDEDQYVRFYAEKDFTIELEPDFELHLDMGLGRFVKIGNP